MTTAHDIYLEATRRGLRLEPAGDKLAVIPKGKCPPDFINVLRHHKRELLDLLETRAVALRPDEIPWLNIARQVMDDADGEFAGADRSTVESLTIGLRGINHPLCRRALERLKGTTRGTTP
jgi:hypothetical protein